MPIKIVSDTDLDNKSVIYDCAVGIRDVLKANEDNLNVTDILIGDPKSRMSTLLWLTHQGVEVENFELGGIKQYSITYRISAVVSSGTNEADKSAMQLIGDVQTILLANDDRQDDNLWHSLNTVDARPRPFRGRDTNNIYKGYYIDVEVMIVK